MQRRTSPGGEPELTSYDEYADDDDASSWASGATIESEPEVSFDWYAFREQEEVVFNWRNAERDAQADAPLGPQNAPGEQVLEFEWTYHEESGIAVGVAPASAVDDAAHELVVAAPAGGGSVEHDAAGDEAGTLLAALAAQVGAIAASNMEASDEPDWI